MDIEKVGKAISCLRKRAAYTQKDLRDRIGISDKAVSKWERGLGLPEIGYLRKLSILLDTDTDSLLAGDIFHHDGSWSGVVVIDNNAWLPDISLKMASRKLSGGIWKTAAGGKK